jgi:hypothetical protein
MTMTTVKRFRLVPLCSVAVAALGIIVGPAPAPADNGCPTGLVPRNARPGDQVCVTQQVATEVAQENANAANLRQPGGGAYGPLTCKSGYVWREAFDGDGVCVTPDRRQETLNQNAVPQSGPTPPASVGACPPTCLPTTLPVTTPSPTPIAPPAQLPNLLPPPPPKGSVTTTTTPPPASVGACPPTCLPTTLPVTTPSPTPIAPPAQLPNLLPPPPPRGHITVTDAPPTSVGPLPTSTMPLTTPSPTPIAPPAQLPNPPPAPNQCDPRVDICVH